MKHLMTGSVTGAVLLALIATTGCQPNADVAATFDANAATVSQAFADFTAESDDFFTHFSDDATWSGNAVGSADTLTLDVVTAGYRNMWSQYDYRMVTEANMLPGVNPNTKMTDGSVRGYFRWEISKAATDSTEARSVEVKLYESFDFNAEGKIRWTQVYGDLATAYNLLEE